MAEFNGKKGRWVTSKTGRKVFIEGEEDLVDKQSREIAEREKTTKELNDEKKQNDKQDTDNQKVSNDAYPDAPNLSTAEKLLNKDYKLAESQLKEALAYLKSDPEITEAFIDKISRFAWGNAGYTQFVQSAITKNNPKLMDNGWGLWQFVRVYNDFVSGKDTQQYLDKPHKY